MIAMAGLFLRQRHLPRLRDRDDAGRRRRNARLADRAAGAARQARRPRREGPHPAAAPTAPRQRREPGLVGDPDTRASPPARLRARRDRGPAGAGIPPPRHADEADRPRVGAARGRHGRDAQPDPGRLPRRRGPALVAIKANANSPETQKAVEELRTKALASGQMRGPIQVEVNPARTVTRVAIP